MLGRRLKKIFSRKLIKLTMNETNEKIFFKFCDVPASVFINRIKQRADLQSPHD